jgi:hypothetical protein
VAYIDQVGPPSSIIPHLYSLFQCQRSLTRLRQSGVTGKWCHRPRGAQVLFLWSSLSCTEVFSRVIQHFRNRKCGRFSLATHAARRNPYNERISGKPVNTPPCTGPIVNDSKETSVHRVTIKDTLVRTGCEGELGDQTCDTNVYCIS